MDERKQIILNHDLQMVLENHPDLYVVYKDNRPVSLQGVFKIIDNEGVLQEQFEIKILIPKQYPHGFPILIETSTLIPREDDRHISKEGFACVEITQKANIIAKRGISISQFVDRYVYRYFCWQLLYEYDENARDHLEEWRHKNDGVFDFYIETIGTKGVQVLIAVLELAIMSSPNPYFVCPCGAEKKLKWCHWQTLLDIRKIGLPQLKIDLEFLKSKLNTDLAS